MATNGQPVGVTSLAVVVVLCISLILSSKSRRDRACCADTRTCKQDEFKSSNSPDAEHDGTSHHIARDRRAPEDEPAFSLYGGGVSDAEPSAPSMELSTSVLALLESFDVDPVRGMFGLNLQSVRT